MVINSIEDFEERLKSDEEDMIQLVGRQEVWQRAMVTIFPAKIK